MQISFGQPPTPEREGENLLIDIFYEQNCILISCIDSYSKYLVLKKVPSKLNAENKVSEIFAKISFSQNLDDR